MRRPRTVWGPGYLARGPRGLAWSQFAGTTLHVCKRPQNSRQTLHAIRSDITWQCRTLRLLVAIMPPGLGPKMARKSRPVSSLPYLQPSGGMCEPLSSFDTARPACAVCQWRIDLSSPDVQISRLSPNVVFCCHECKEYAGTHAPRALRALLHIRDNPGKGVGVFAGTDFKAGAVILVEAAQLLSSELDNGDIPACTARACRDLVGGDSVGSLFRFNGFSIRGVDGTPDDDAIFITAARFNHSCIANCEYAFATSDTIEVTVVKPVAKDEELTIAYVSLLQSSAERAGRLKEDFGFECTCPACVDATVRAKVRRAHHSFGPMHQDACRIARCHEQTTCTPSCIPARFMRFLRWMPTKDDSAQIESAVNVLETTESMARGAAPLQEIERVHEHIGTATEDIAGLGCPGLDFEFISRMCAAILKIPGASLSGYPDRARDAVEGVYGRKHMLTRAAIQWQASIYDREDRIEQRALAFSTRHDSPSQIAEVRAWKRGRLREGGEAVPIKARRGESARVGPSAADEAGP